MNRQNCITYVEFHSNDDHINLGCKKRITNWISFSFNDKRV